jgi:hypothetical protein
MNVRCIANASHDELHVSPAVLVLVEGIFVESDVSWMTEM